MQHKYSKKLEFISDKIVNVYKNGLPEWINKNDIGIEACINTIEHNVKILQKLAGISE